MKAFKSFFPLLIAAVAIWVPATGFGLTPETDLNDNIIAPVEGAAGAVAFAGVGPAVAGSVDYSKLPSKARKFLERYCDGHAIVRCDKTYASSTYTVGLANGILMTFDSKGAITDITAPENYSLSPYLLKAVVPGSSIICLSTMVSAIVWRASTRWSATATASKYATLCSTKSVSTSRESSQ